MTITAPFAFGSGLTAGLDTKTREQSHEEILPELGSGNGGDVGTRVLCIESFFKTHVVVRDAGATGQHP